MSGICTKKTLFLKAVGNFNFANCSLRPAPTDLLHSLCEWIIKIKSICSRLWRPANIRKQTAVEPILDSFCLSVCLSVSLSLSFIVHLARMQCASKGNEIELWNNYDINSNESEPGSRKSTWFYQLNWWCKLATVEISQLKLAFLASALCQIELDEFTLVFWPLPTQYHSFFGNLPPLGLVTVLWCCRCRCRCQVKSVK